jgi:hypothetical protein
MCTSFPECEPYTIKAESNTFNMLETLRRPVYDLLHAGSKVHIEHSNCLLDWDTKGMVIRSITSDDNNFFHMSAEEWPRVRVLHDSFIVTVSGGRGGLHCLSGDESQRAYEASHPRRAN